MNISVLTLFPSIIEGYFSQSIMKRAISDKLISLNLINIRDFAENTHKRCDDELYGGGYGMLLKPEPLARALDSCISPNSHVLYPSPSATLFVQGDAQRLSQKEDLIFICGRYEGIDQRIIDMYVDECLSIGEYVLSSGEIASLCIIDSVYRLVNGVIRQESLQEESYNDDNLEYPQYTRPEEFRGHKVPSVLLSGNHKAIEEWRSEQSRQKSHPKSKQ